MNIELSVPLIKLNSEYLACSETNYQGQHLVLNDTIIFSSAVAETFFYIKIRGYSPRRDDIQKFR